MDHSNIRTFKRPLDIPSREQLAAIFNPPKRLKNSQSLDNASVPRGSHNDENIPTDSTTKQNSLNDHRFNTNQQLNKNSAPFLNSVPPNIVPIVHPPAITSDFFTDVTTDLSNEYTAQQIYGIVKKFPPPIPPPPPQLYPDIDDDVSDDERGGIMVPFIYPPPPIVNIDTLPFSLTEFRRKFKKSLQEMEEQRSQAAAKASVEASGSKAQSNDVESQTGSNVSGSAAPPTAPTPTKRGRKPKLRPDQIQAAKEEEEAKAHAKAQEKLEREAVARKQNLEASNLTNVNRASNEGEQTQPEVYPAPPVDNDRYVFVRAPPLPFPPPNYMAYPLSAQKSSLAPDDVFSSWLEANEQLPRVDMVLASAAGTLFDLRKDAAEKGLTKYDLEMQKLRNQAIEISLDDSSDEESANEDIQNDDESYYAKIDDEIYQDVYQAQWPKVNLFNKMYSDPEYASVNSQLSNVKDKPMLHGKKELEDLESYPSEVMTGLERVDRLSVFPSTIGEFISSTGAMKDKRRKNLRTHLEKMEEFELRNREDIYRSKKYNLLQRIEHLRESKIHFRNSVILDDELKRIQQKLEIERDYELVKLKLFEKYELLKNSLIFYEDSNKVYKHLNGILINKLEKLKNFFEYQQELFVHLLEQQNKSGGGDVFDISNKNSSKLFHGISRKADKHGPSPSSSDEGSDETNGQLDHASESDKLLTEMLNSSSKFALVHDFMPLITQEEFNIITSDVPKKLKPPTSAKHSMKHQIFANPIYDRLMTSGSDTNASDSNTSGFKSGTPQPQLSTPGPKRRGRRAAGTTNIGQSNVSQNGNASTSERNCGGVSGSTGAAEAVNVAGATGTPTMRNTYMRDTVAFNHQYTEAGLLAKITKQFYGPQLANSEELNHDLRLMGIESRWPVGK